MSDENPAALPNAVPPLREFVWPSRVLCVIAVLFCSTAAAWVPSDREFYLHVYRDFLLKVPVSTQLILDLPNGVIYGVGGLTVIGLVAAQRLFRRKRTAGIVHIGTIAVYSLALLVYREAILQVFINLFIGMMGVPQRGAGGK